MSKNVKNVTGYWSRSEHLRQLLQIKSQRKTGFDNKKTLDNENKDNLIIYNTLLTCGMIRKCIA